MKKVPIILTILIFAACAPSALSPVENKPEKSPKFEMISVDELAQALASKDFLFVNVHIPVEGNIPETDLNIDYDKIIQNLDQFPVDKNEKIILYCRSAAMGNTAGRTLAELGYKNVFNLEGGYNKWIDAGYLFLLE